MKDKKYPKKYIEIGCNRSTCHGSGCMLKNDIYSALSVLPAQYGNGEDGGITVFSVTVD